MAICCWIFGLLPHDPVSFQCKLFHSNCVFDVFMGENECHVFLLCHFEHLLQVVIIFLVQNMATHFATFHWPLYKFAMFHWPLYKPAQFLI